MKNICYYQTKLGRIGIGDNGESITDLCYINDQLKKEIEGIETPLIRKTYAQLAEYLKGERTVFDIPINPQGTAFQKQVWKALREIPYGKTCTYGEIARKIGNPKASRAVGMANNKNPIAIIIPCHRVIGASGKLVGYAGGLDIKEKLLSIEGWI